MLSENVKNRIMTVKEQAFLSLVQAHSGIIHKVIRLYVDHEEDRKDLYQEILCQVWISMERFDQRSKFSTWLYKVGLNTVLTFKRKEKKPMATVADDMAFSEPSDEAERLLVAIKHLEEIDRLIITLHLEGYENDEVAEITGISKNYVAVKLHRIKGELMKKLKP